MSWLDVARSLPLGHKQRLQHDCGEGKALIVSHNNEGYSGYCFRCGNIGFEPHGKRSLAELARVRELNEAALAQQPQEMPDDITNEIHPNGLRWLRNGGLYGDAISRAGIGYSPSLQRVVLPVRSTDPEVPDYWQARAVHPGQTPKYINPPYGREAVLYWATGQAYGADARRNDRLVITEDILSASRVGKQVLACSALGTKLSLRQSAMVVQAADDAEATIYIWLDPDKAGRDGSEAMLRELSLLSDRVKVITSRGDPKSLCDREIREVLGLPPNHKYKYYGSTAR